MPRLRVSRFAKCIHLLFMHEVTYDGYLRQFYMFRDHRWITVTTDGLYKEHLIPIKILQNLDKMTCRILGEIHSIEDMDRAIVSVKKIRRIEFRSSYLSTRK